MNSEKRFAIYSRKSRFTGKGESIENQLELCRKFIQNNYGNEAAENAIVFEDEGFSGKNLERPMFKKMMVEAREGKLSAVVVYRLDRISRNVGDFSNLIEELRNLDVSFISIREQFDTATPMGRAMMNIASVFAQLERETTAERIRDNMHELAKTGRWLGGTTPLGYCSEAVTKLSVDGKMRKACRLKIVSEETEIVKLIYEKYIETNSLTRTDTFLLNNFYKTRKGKNFSRFSIRAILTNPVYMKADRVALKYLVNNDICLFSDKEDFDGEHGIMAYNRTLQEQGKTTKIRPMNEWIVSVGAHEGIIEAATWVKVQKMLNLNSSKTYRKPRSNVALLSGVLFCGNCGDYMRPKLSNRYNSKGEQLYTYLCNTKERSCSKLCSNKIVNGNILDGNVIEEIKKLTGNSSFLECLENIKKCTFANSENPETELKLLKEQSHEKEKEISNLVSILSKTKETATEQYILKHIEELHIEKRAIDLRIDESKQLMIESQNTNIEFDVLKQLFPRFSYTVDSMSVEERRAAIRELVRKIIWDGENVHIYMVGSDEDNIFTNYSRNRKGFKDYNHAANNDETLCEDSK